MISYRRHTLQDLQMLTATADPELSGVISLMFLMRSHKGRQGGRSGAFRSDFLIDFNKKPEGKSLEKPYRTLIEPL